MNHDIRRNLMPTNMETLEAAIPSVTGLAVSYVRLKNDCANSKCNLFRKFKWIGPFLIIFSMFIFVRSSFADTIDLETIVNGVNKAMNPPVMIGSVTRFDGVKALGDREIGYFYTLVNYPSDSPQLSKMLPILKSTLITNGCKDPRFSYFFKNGITITMIFSSNDNQVVLRATVSASDCNSLN